MPRSLALRPWAVLAWMLGWVVALIGTAITPASAQPPGLRDPVSIEVVASVEAVRPGQTLALAVVFEIDEGWKVHTNKPEVPASWGDLASTLIPTTIDVTSSAQGGSPPARAGPIQWPTPVVSGVDLLGTGTPEPYKVFKGTAVAFVPVVVEADATGSITWTLSIDYQPCDDTTCLMPTTVERTISVPVLAAGAPAPPPVRPGLFRDFDTSVFASVGQWASSATPSVATPEPTAAPQPSRTFFGIPLPQGGGVATVLVLFALAALGGLVLNLTPCVLPVLPLKVMTLTQHAGGSGKRTLVLGLWMALGVVAFWVAIGVPVLIFASFSDPSRLFAIWWVTLGMGLLIAAMALGLMGLFNINLPQSLYMINPKADTPGGSFVFGVMTAVLGLPCFGFVAGALLAAAATLPKIATMAIFLGLGVGMALPYFLLALKPAWLKSIPRTGPASELVKQVMGLLLLAAAAYFVGSGLIALVSERPWLGKELHNWLIALLGFAAAGWLVVRTFQITPSALRRVAFVLVGAVIAAGGFWWASTQTTRARETYLAKRAAQEAAMGQGALVSGVWIDYHAALFERARSENRVVVLDFTAEWCINCKVLKATVLDREPVRSELGKDGTITMVVDLTSTSAPGWKLLEELGQVGIPTLAIYTPGSSTPWVANAYTPVQVVDALRAARQGGGPARQNADGLARLEVGSVQPDADRGGNDGP